VKIARKAAAPRATSETNLAAWIRMTARRVSRSGCDPAVRWIRIRFARGVHQRSQEERDPRAMQRAGVTIAAMSPRTTPTKAPVPDTARSGREALVRHAWPESF